MAQTTLNFGIEIELLLGPRKKSSQHSSWKSLAKDVSKRLAKAGIPNHINDSNDKSPHNYREWSITQEITIPSQPAKGLFGIELVSPILSSSPSFISSYFPTQLSVIFSTLSNNFSIHPSPHCSTHVHVSFSSSSSSYYNDQQQHQQQQQLDWDWDWLSSLAKSALYFESALDMLVPAYRGRTTGTGTSGPTAAAGGGGGGGGGGGATTNNNNNYWCQSNRSNPSLRDLPFLSQCLRLIDRSYSAQGVSGVVRSMNLFPCGSAYGRSHGWKGDRVRGKVYKWDFSGLLLGFGGPNNVSSMMVVQVHGGGGGGDRGGGGHGHRGQEEELSGIGGGSGGSGGGVGTIEYRQPPGSLGPDDAVGWAKLVLAFVAGSMVVGPRLSGCPPGGTIGSVGTEVVNEEGASMDDLWEVLVGGADMLGWGQDEVVGQSQSGLGREVEELFARAG